MILGLQVNNWNEARIDRTLAAEYLDRLELEVSCQITTLVEQREYYEQAQRHGLAADRAFKQPADALGTQFLSLRADCTIVASPALVAENVRRLHGNGNVRKLLWFQLDILDNRIVNPGSLIESSRRLKTGLDAVRQ